MKFWYFCPYFCSIFHFICSCIFSCDYREFVGNASNGGHCFCKLNLGSINRILNMFFDLCIYEEHFEAQVPSSRIRNVFKLIR